ncbi:ATP-dependent RNA helicase HrpB [Thiorhodovibrio winogradskyi]|uniref:ATP-dependent RNA helicase HrpB n=1 Tax=Thiorhodovibrio winogradskyi TaxID=77007 RepID=A0ABZ0SE06_9GAMM|nr:ATP-dependent RNA helicase HrpA [Thiorhodovibrio winogradskyi]
MDGLRFPMNVPTEADLVACLLRDRPRLRRHLRTLKSTLGQEFGRDPLEQGLVNLQQAMSRSQAVVEQRRQLAPAIVGYPPDLPVSARREEVAALIEDHQVIVLCGETGSGKSTQLPKICLELGRGLFGRIGHTQPRRIAARSLASRIAAELGAGSGKGPGTELGGLVGYKVRFNDRVRPETRIKLLTDGMLLAEIQQDRWLNEYDTLIIDEAHERSLNIDFLLGVLKQLLPRRPELKVIVTSATIDPRRFARHFADPDGTPAPIIEISGRTYPVETRYRPPAEEHAGERDEAMQAAISEAVAELAREGRGDVLVFLSGEREIRETAETLRKHHPPATEILPLYARQGPAEQARVFQPHGTRRVVLATNVAETSLTVPGIHYVIDPGFARISRYSHRTKVQRLPVERISRASANQRQGRCGRIANGICIRLYDEDSFQARAEFTEPEIQRTNLAAVILRMKQLGFGAIEDFPFIDAPDSRLINDGYRTLEELAALDAEGRLTPLGKQLARLPVDPRIGRLLLAGAEHHCLRELLIIAAALSVQDPRERPLDKRQAADEIHASFRHEDSDFLGFLNLWNFLAAERRKLSRRKFQNLCRLHFLSWTRVQEWRDIHAQLREQLGEMGLVARHEPGVPAREIENQTDPLDQAAAGSYEEIHRALLTGLLSNIGVKDEQREYLGARNSRFAIHPGSGLAPKRQRGNQAQGESQKTPKWILVAERVETTKHYGRTVAKIQPAWIETAGAHLTQRSYFEPHWQARAGQVAAFEKVTLYGLTLVPRRRVNYGPINPAEAREIFLRFALTEGDFDTRAPFWRHNAELIESVRHLEAKSRRRDILVDEEAIYAFYDQRVPSGIYSKPQFERWLRQALKKQPKMLHMSLTDVMRPDYNREAAGITAEAFPDALRVGATELPLDYHFDPGHQADGVTLVLPLPLINQIAPERLEWLVPGLLEERITALLRGLPKPIRKALVPVPETAAKLVARLSPSERPLIQALSEEVRALTGQVIPEDAWDESVIPEHLRMKVRLIDQDGRALATSGDLIALKRQHGQAGGARFAAIPSAGLEREGLTRWDFGDVPEQVELDRGGIRLRGYPALVDEGKTVALRVLDSETSADQAMRAGLRRLIMLRLAADMRALRRQLPGLDRMRLQYAKAPVAATAQRGGPPDLADELIALILDLSFLEDQPRPRSQSAFEQCLARGKPRLFPTANEVQALAAEILGSYQNLRKQLAGVTQINWLESVRDMQGQLDGLVFRGFLQQVPFSQLKHYPRYLKAMGQRAEKLFHAAGRDRALLVDLRPLLDQYQERQKAAKNAGREDARLAEIRWMLEELRVSFFAQSLGTAYPVSIKRFKARWRELGL